MDAALEVPTQVAGPRGTKAALAVTIFGFLSMVAYWVIWFFVDRSWLATSNTPEYLAFENAFPLADGWMALCSLLSAIALSRRRASALLWMLLGGSASVYLGLMDVLFDLQHGLYRPVNGDWGPVIVEVAINVVTLALGAWIAGWAWRQKDALLGWRRH